MWRPDHTVQNPSHFSSSSPSFSDPIGGAAAGGSLVGALPSPATGMAVPWSCARARRLPFSFRPPPFCRVTRSGGGRFGSPEEAAALVQIPSPARALARVRARRRRAGLHRCPSPHVEQRLGSSSPNAEAMSPRRAAALAFLSAHHGWRWSSSRCVPSALSLLGLVIAFSFQLRFEIELHLVLSLFLSIRKRILSKSIYSIDRLWYHC